MVSAMHAEATLADEALADKTLADEAPLLDALIAEGLLIPTGVEGLYGRSGAFERVLEAIDAAATRLGAGDGAEVIRFPPGLNRAHFERSGYLKGFPHLAGTVHCFCGDEREHRRLLECVEAGGEWTAGQRATDIVLTPAACYPVYPMLAARGPLPAGGALVDVASYCFRHEPSREPTRQQMFRMREYVRVGSPEQVVAFREVWHARMGALAAALGLPHEIDVANDPFFGRSGRILAESQRQQKLKLELLVPVNRGAAPTACMSLNHHLDHFGQVWDLRLADGAVAHSACVGFGLERLTLALFRHHGPRVGDWPAAVRDAMWA
jgi:seryl-tRNA synthetase